MIRSTQLRSACRALLKYPVTSTLAVLALGLGIGLTTSMFNLVHGVLLSGVPFQDPDRLMTLATYDLDEGPQDFQTSQVSLHDFRDWQEQQKSFVELAASENGVIDLNDEAGFPERFSGGFLTWNLLRTLGVEPILGRAFLPEDDVPGAPRVILLGYDLWRHRFNSDPAILGRTLRVNGEATEVIGVMPAGFAYPLFEDCWLPMQPDIAELERGTAGSVWVLGRLRDGVSRAEAQAELTALNARLAEIYPTTNAGRGALVTTYRRSLNSSLNTSILGVMFGAVSLVLLIACANVASLLLARSSRRSRELAIRTALGGRRWQVMSLIVTESMILSVLGSVLGLGIAHLGTRFMASSFDWQTLPYWITFETRPSAFVFVAAAGMATGILSGLLPALRASGAVSFDLLQDESRGSSGLRISRISRLLVIGELALACALLVATSLLVRTVVNYQGTDLGFDSESILTARISLPESDYPAEADILGFYERLLEDLHAAPGVETAAAMSGPPGTLMGFSYYGLEGESYVHQSDYPSAPRGVVTPDFFKAYGIPVKEGRLFGRQDTATSPPVVMVNESFVAQTWPGQSALGQRLKLGRGDEDEPWRTVVGVVPDAGISFLNPAFAGTTAAGFYVPHAQLPKRTLSLAIKTRGDAAAFVTPLRERIRRLDAGLPLDEVRTMERVVWEVSFSTKVIAVSFSAFGLIALLLTSVGIFGVMLFAVHQRSQEIGVRIALGARPRDVLGLILRQGMGRVIIGLSLGLGLSWGLAAALRVVLFGVEPGDPASFLGAVAVLSSVALLASFVPAWRASRLDPLVVLRE